MPAGGVLSCTEQRPEGRRQIHRRDQAVAGVKIKMDPGDEEEELQVGELRLVIRVGFPEEVTFQFR